MNGKREDSGGEGGIRTPDTVFCIPVFKTGAIAEYRNCDVQRFGVRRLGMQCGFPPEGLIDEVQVAGLRESLVILGRLSHHVGLTEQNQVFAQLAHHCR